MSKALFRASADDAAALVSPISIGQATPQIPVVEGEAAPDALDFNSRVRAHTVFLLLLLAATIASLRIIARWRRRSNSKHGARLNPARALDEDEDDDDDSLDAILPRLALAISLAAAITQLNWFLVRAATLHHLVRHIDVSVNHLPPPFTWADRTLLDSVAADAKLVTHAAVYILLPVTYFYVETPPQSSTTSVWGWRGRLRDATTVWALVICLCALGWYTLSSLLGLDAVLMRILQDSPVSTEAEYDSYLSFLPSFMASRIAPLLSRLYHVVNAPFSWFNGLVRADAWILIVSAILSLRALPLGFIAMLTWCRRWPLHPSHRTHARAKLTRIAFEEAVWRRRLGELSGATGVAGSAAYRPRSGSATTSTTASMSAMTRQRQRITRVESASDLSDTDFEAEHRNAELASHQDPDSETCLLSPSSITNYDFVRERAMHLKRQHGQLQRSLKRSPLRRNTAFVFLLACVLLGCALTVFRIALTFLRSMLPPAEYEQSTAGTGNHQSASSVGGALVDLFAEALRSAIAHLVPDIPIPELPRLIPSQHQLLPPALDTSLRFFVALYFALCIVIGVYSQGWFRKLYPTHSARIGTRRAVANVMLWCLMSQAIPVLASVLMGIGGMVGGGSSRDVDWQSGWAWWLAVQAYRAAAFAALGLKVIERGVVKGKVMGLGIHEWFTRPSGVAAVKPTTPKSKLTLQLPPRR